MGQKLARRFALFAATLCVAFAAACALLAVAPQAFAEQTANADLASDPSTSDGNVAILGEGAPNTLNSGRVWTDKSVYTADTTVDGNNVSNDGDFLVVFSALGSSTARTGKGFDGVPSSPIAGEEGALTYTDQFGEYMEPTGDVTVISFGRAHTYKGSEASDALIEYLPETDESVANLSYGDANKTFKLSDISIAARKDDASGCWVMSITIPARALPLYLSILGYDIPDDQGNQALSSFTTNADDISSSPLRIAYSVGLSQNVKSGDALDFTKISDEYQSAHLVQTDEGARIAFYSNYYDDPTEVIAPDATYGNTLVEFTPAADNNFYYFQDHLTVYRNGAPGTYTGDPAIFGNVSNPVLDMYEIQSNLQRTFYVVRNYYRRAGTGGIYSAYEVVAYVGSDLVNAVCYYDPSSKASASAPGPSIVVATSVGCPCMGNAAKFRTKKASNETGTAAYSYFGFFIVDPNVAGAFDIEAHYGNNGIMTIAYAKSDELEASGLKQIRINDVLQAPGSAGYDAFEFWLFPSRSNPTGDPVSSSGISASSNADGEFLFNIGSYAQPGEYLYSIREAIPSETVAGLSYDPAMYLLRVIARVGSDGKIVLETSMLKDGVELPAGQQMTFANSYSTDSVSIPIQGQVELEGANLKAGMFSFILEAVSAEDATSATQGPMPGSTQVTNAQGGMFSFGNITFSRAGTYVYRVYQDVASQGAAMDYLYDASRYLITFTVNHSASGPLYIITSIHKDGDVDATDTISFVNRVKTPELAVDKTQGAGDATGSGPLVVSAGDVIVYRITVTNPSSIAVRDVLVYDEVPSGLVLPDDLESHERGPYIHNGKLYWIVRQLAAGESVTIEFAVTVPNAPATAFWSNIAYAEYPELVDPSKAMIAASAPVHARYRLAPAPSDPSAAPEAAGQPDAPAAHPASSHAVLAGDSPEGLPALLLGMLAALGALSAGARRRLSRPARTGPRA